MAQLEEKQIAHILQLTGIAIRYVTDCQCDCSECPIGKHIIKHGKDLPDLPKELTICNLFDYISQNS